MGGTPSKVNRRLPKLLDKPFKPSTVPGGSPVKLSKESKDHSIDADGRDPQFMANLRELGQVNVEVPITMRRTEERILNMYEARKISEQQVASPHPIPNYLPAASLANLLEDRKFMTSKTEVRRLAARYNFNYSSLEDLVRFVTTPSIGEGTVVRTKNSATGEEKMTMKAVWSEPIFQE